MLELARRAGIVVPDKRLVEVSEIKGLPEEARAPGSKALAVERFDRAAGAAPVHMEDFAQVFGQCPHDKYHFRSYANIASVLWAEADEDDVAEFVRRLVFSVVIGNGDMHLKNWSLLYPDQRKPVLSPGYDFVAISLCSKRDARPEFWRQPQPVRNHARPDAAFCRHGPDSGKPAVEDRGRDGGARRRRVEGPGAGGPAAQGSARLHRQADFRDRSYSAVRRDRVQRDTKLPSARPRNVAGRTTSVSPIGIAPHFA